MNCKDTKKSRKMEDRSPKLKSEIQNPLSEIKQHLSLNLYLHTSISNGSTAMGNVLHDLMTGIASPIYRLKAHYSGLTDEGFVLPEVVWHDSLVRTLQRKANYFCKTYENNFTWSCISLQRWSGYF